MLRFTRFVAVIAALGLGAGPACSKFAATGEETPDAGEVADGAPDAAAQGDSMKPRLYVYGGVDVSKPAVTTAFVTIVGPDGELGPWTPAPVLRNDRYAAAWAQSGNVLLAAGGTFGGTASSKDAARGALPTDPTSGLDVWSVTPSLSTARRYASAFVRGSSVYVSGGRDDTAAVGNIERYDIANGTWAAAGALAVGVAGHATFLHDSRMYVVGGDPLGGAPLTTSVRMAAFDDRDESVLGSMPAGDLKTAVARHSVALVDSWVYVIGGDGIGGSALATVQRGTFNAAGLLQFDLLATLDVPAGQTGLADACTVVLDHTIYVIGGRDSAKTAATNAVHIGRVAPDGTIKWTTSPSLLPEGRAAFGCAISPSSAP